MQIVVTGGNGMVGKHIERLKGGYPQHTFLFLTRRTCNLADRNSVLDWFFAKKIDYIIHLAACVGGLFMNLDNNIKMFSENIKINENILEACVKNKINRGIFCLSSCIYTPKPHKFPMDEKQIHEGPPHVSNEGYAYAKRMLEMQCRRYNDQGCEFICVIPVNLYGEYDNFSIKNGHVIPSLMNKFYTKLQNHEDCEHEITHTVYGTGSALRQFVYAGDFAKLICKILLDGTYESVEPVIICNTEINIRTMIYTLANVMNVKNTDIIFDTSKSDGCYKKTVDNSKLMKLYPDFKFKSLHQGLEITYEWFKANYDVIRK